MSRNLLNLHKIILINYFWVDQLDHVITLGFKVFF